MKKLLVILCATMLLLSGTLAFAQSTKTVPTWPQVYTLKVYDASNVYANLGGVTTVASGTSAMTVTASGAWASTADHRTIDLRSTEQERGARIFTIALGSSEDTFVSGQFSGVTLERSATFPASTTALCSARLKFSPVDSAAYWSGASYYQVDWMAGASRQVKMFYNATTYAPGAAGVASQRYMRVDFVSGVSAVRNPYATLTVWPQ